MDNQWEWWAGFADDVDCEGIYTIGCWKTRAEAIEHGKAAMPDNEGNTHFYIIEAIVDPNGDPSDEFIPFVDRRNMETIYISPEDETNA